MNALYEIPVPAVNTEPQKSLSENIKYEIVFCMCFSFIAKSEVYPQYHKDDQFPNQPRIQIQQWSQSLNHTC